MTIGIRCGDRCFDDLLKIQRRHVDQGEVAVGAMSFVEYELIEA